MATAFTSRVSVFSVLSLALLILLGPSAFAQTEADYYALEDIPIPDGVELEVGGMDFLPDGRLAVCTRRGEIWLIADPYGNEPTYTRFARGLHEPLGLTYRDGALYCTQRGEITRMTDRNGDDKADVFETVYQLPLTGNYHEYHYGPLFRPDGSMLVTLNVGWEGQGVSKVKWRGWMLALQPDGTLAPYAAGMRSPAGFGTDAQGEVFVAENQGDWIGSGRITHLRRGDFAGHPASLNWVGEPNSPLSLRREAISDDFQTMYAAKASVPQLKLPAVWFPHGIMGISTAAIITDTTAGAFGPFAGDLLVSDQGQSKIMRVALEEVAGEYQGAVFPFREGFESGLLRLNFGRNATLFAGMTSRGWASTGPELFGLQRLRWTGKVPFEMKAIRARQDGFAIEFTEPVDPASLSAADFSLTSFTYLYREQYGSPVVDQQPHRVAAVQLQPNGQTVHLTLTDFRPGYIYEIRLDDLRSDAGQPLLHDVAYYTLNYLPGNDARIVAGTTEALALPGASAKRRTDPPADWNGEIDATIRIESELGMKFKQTFLSVTAGDRVRLEFYNPDDMQHNWLLTQIDRRDAVGELAAQMGLDGLAKDYVPDSDLVLFHTRLVEPETSDVIYFRAPERPGAYPYVCTVPGHYKTMWGILQVTAPES